LDYYYYYYYYCSFVMSHWQPRRIG
jgi:hypothetical protein